MEPTQHHLPVRPQPTFISFKNFVLRLQSTEGEFAKTVELVADVRVPFRRLEGENMDVLVADFKEFPTADGTDLMSPEGYESYDAWRQ